MRPNLKIAASVSTLAVAVLASCSPTPLKENLIFNIPPEGVSAVQIDSARTRLESCNIGGNQQARLGRSTYWSPALGSAGSDPVDLHELEDLKNTGDCDANRPILIKDKVARGILENESKNSSTKESPYNPFIPISEDISLK